MRLGAALFVLITFYGLNYSVSAVAQTIPAKSDSVVVAPNTPTKETSIVAKEAVAAEPVKEKKGFSKPDRAALYSAIIPGAGQVYNKDYWKVPIIYAIGGTIAYFIVDNNDKYVQYRDAIIIRSDDDPDTFDQYYLKYPGQAGTNYLRIQRDYYHTNRDLSVIIFFLTYGLNVVEAYVGANLNEYDISDDLSLQVKPSLQFSAMGAAPAPGLTLNFRLKN